MIKKSIYDERNSLFSNCKTVEEKLGVINNSNCSYIDYTVITGISDYIKVTIIYKDTVIATGIKYSSKNKTDITFEKMKEEALKEALAQLEW